MFSKTIETYTYIIGAISRKGAKKTIEDATDMSKQKIGFIEDN